MQSAAPRDIQPALATFCLIHGNWHDASCWAPLVDELRSRGHDAVAPDLPFDDPRADYQQRARPALDALEGADDPVVIVGHSAGSAEAALVAAQRRPALLVYLCPRFGAFPTPPHAPRVFRPKFPFPPKDADGRSVWDAGSAIATMYPRLPPDVATTLAERLRPGAAAAGDYPLAEHPNVRASLIYTTDDEFFEPEWERYVAELLMVEPIELRGGHFPMVEDPAGLAEVLDGLATGTVPEASSP
ncbi:MAG: alpha/beta fold hydrolase [Gaiellaceae bacterium]